MENRYEYRATAYWVLAQRGIVSAEDVPQAIEFSSPPEFGGEGNMWTPEHFLLSAIASCYLSTFRAIAEHSKFDTVSLDVSVQGVLEKEPGGYRFTNVRIQPVLTVMHEDEKERGLKLLEKAERACLVSRSLNSTVRLQPKIQVTTAV
ncbi:MAG TPA: OsmC family protein [Clostridia bacterium]|nr:OsmC family protein [Clostridia bacterium]